MRRRLGFSEPYTPEQFEAFKAAFKDCAKMPDDEAETLFDDMWPKIQRSALACEQKLSIEQYISKEKGGARVRTLRRNRNRVLREAEKRHDARWLLTRHPEETDALLYGAMEAGLVDEENQLWDLDLDSFKKAIRTALEKGSILANDGGRPSNTPIAPYEEFLATIYRRIADVPSIPTTYDNYKDEWRNPALPLFWAATAPFQPNLRPRGWIDRIRKADKNSRAKNC